MKQTLVSFAARGAFVCLLVLLTSCAEGVAPQGMICVGDADCPTGEVCRGGQCTVPGQNDAGAALDGGLLQDGGSVDGGVVDGGAAADGGADGGGDDAGPPDAGTGLPFGERCTGNADCQSQICLTTGRVSFCTRMCSQDCPSDYECKAYVIGNRVVPLCTPFTELYCIQCTASAQCARAGDACTSVGGADYCTRDCSQTNACPADYDCQEIPLARTVEGRAALGDGGMPDGGDLGDGGGATVKQCLPRSGLCPGCIDNDSDGYGVGADCLGPDCNDSNRDIHPGAAEVCDGIDNNCDGNIDETFDLRTDNANCGACGRACGQGLSCCESDCVDRTTSMAHCGACNSPCIGSGRLCCTGSCRDTTSEAAHCGGCDLACTNEHGDVACSSSLCAPTCTGGFGDCDTNARNGCETALTTIDNCGSCGVICTNMNGTARCVTARCEPSCNMGFGDCDGLPNNGCEQNTQFNAGAHCGACNAPCQNAQGTTSCESGQCVPVCDGDFGNCDTNARNGCETDLRTTREHCGACNHACSTINASSATCTDRACDLVCNAGFYDCNKDPTDGCESDLSLVQTCGACTLDADCPGDFYCRDNMGAKVCTKKKPLGDACVLGVTPAAPGRECQSGQCIDGVCCESTCEGGCRACNIVGSRGFCTFLPIGAPDPRAQCTPQLASTCARDGTCDGAGGCRLHTSGTLCEAQACSAGSQSNPRSCDGFGTCRVAIPPTTLCSPYLCNGNQCFTACDINDPVQCAPNHSCAAGVCKVSGGQPCQNNGQCSTGNCVDGVCCDTPCAGTCKRCDLAGNVGACTNVPSGGDPDNDCPTESESTCGKTGFCSGSGTCSLYPTGTPCASRTCAAGTQTNAKSCDGNGVCLTPSPATATCFPYVCNSGTSSCFGGCTNDLQCATGYGCAAGGVCKKVNGSACAGGAAGNAECQSNFCVDGVCCVGACDGTCERCNALGICDPIVAGSDPDGECPDLTASTCGTTGVCSGQRSCRLYASGTVCNAATCTGDGLSLNRADTCSGGGACQEQGVQSCAPFRCNATSPAVCRTTCTTDGHCATGYSCKVATGECLRSDGQTCSGNADCLNGSCCSGVCRNLANDKFNCGACGRVCQDVNTTSNTCSGGTCNPTCTAGFKSCDFDPVDGCETNIRTLANCGDCGVPCTRSNASATCATQSCAISACNAGFSTCDSNDGNGCEVSHAAVATVCGNAVDLGSACADENHACGFLNASCCNGQYSGFGGVQQGRTSKWFRAEARECSSALFCSGNLKHRITLQSPPTADFDLFIYSDCSNLLGSSIAGTGAQDQVIVTRGDTAGSTDTFNYWVEVRYFSGASCTEWQLTVEGVTQ